MRSYIFISTNNYLGIPYGAKFLFNGSGYTYSGTGDTGPVTLSAKMVENNTALFEREKEAGDSTPDGFRVRVMKPTLSVSAGSVLQYVAETQTYHPVNNDDRVTLDKLVCFSKEFVHNNEDKDLFIVDPATFRWPNNSMGRVHGPFHPNSPSMRSRDKAWFEQKEEPFPATRCYINNAEELFGKKPGVYRFLFKSEDGYDMYVGDWAWMLTTNRDYRTADVKRLQLTEDYKFYYTRRESVMFFQNEIAMVRKQAEFFKDLHQDAPKVAPSETASNDALSEQTEVIGQGVKKPELAPRFTWTMDEFRDIVLLSPEEKLSGAELHIKRLYEGNDAKGLFYITGLDFSGIFQGRKVTSGLQLGDNNMPCFKYETINPKD